MSDPVSIARAARISEALEHLDQANAIFNYVLFALGGFTGIGDPDWDHRLAASAYTSNMLGYSIGETDRETIGIISEEITMRRLPRLLCIALVSAVETCLQDLAELHFRAKDPSSPDEQIAKAVSKVMRGGPDKYLPALADELGISEFKGRSWEYLRELNATRNILVHCTDPIADDRYVANAGPASRAKSGDPLPVDNSYLVSMNVMAKGAFHLLLDPTFAASMNAMTIPPPPALRTGEGASLR